MRILAAIFANFRHFQKIRAIGSCRMGAILAIVFGLSTGGCHSEAAAPYPAATPLRVVQVTRTISPAVVRLDVAQSIYVDGKKTLQRGIGSGVIIDQQGHILTNYHVAGRAWEIYVTLFNKERVPAHLVGDDHWTDLAIVQMDMDAVKLKHIEFSSAQLGDSSKVIVGQDAIAVGTPYGFARTMTRGAISNTERTFYPTRLDIDGYETGDFSNWIQMDVPINPGNSGGPLVDLDGKVIGINTRGGGQGLNFAIPINTARPVISEILRTTDPKTHGYVQRSDLGIDLKPLQDLESFYSVDVNQGVLVNNVDPHSPAEVAGVATQDILLAIDGAPINVRFPEELAAARKRIADLPVGGTVVLTIKRGQEILQLKATTQLLQGYLGDERELPQWGISVREVTRPYAARNRLDDASGVVVTSKAPGSPADEAEIQINDVIHSINGSPVTDLEKLIGLYQRSQSGHDKQVLLDVQRSRAQVSVVLNMSQSNDQSGPERQTAAPTTQPSK